MQLQLPFFPEHTKYINSTLGVFGKDALVYYLHNGSPIYCHGNDDRKCYRFIVGNLIHNQLCTISEFHESTGESRKNIERYAKTFREKGTSHFFLGKETRGQCYKVTESLLLEIQSKLDEGMSLYQAAKDCSISEAAIRYHLKKGTLSRKKKVQ
jgi:hypothetical protein